MAPKHFYVYTLSDPRDGEVFYVGKGCGERMYDHVREARTGRSRNDKKCTRIASIEASGQSVTHQVVACFLHEQDALEFERLLIDQHRKGAQLTNIAPGFVSALERSKARAAFLLCRMVSLADWRAAGNTSDEDMELYREIRRQLERGAAEGFISEIHIGKDGRCHAAF